MQKFFLSILLASSASLVTANPSSHITKLLTPRQLGGENLFPGCESDCGAIFDGTCDGQCICANNMARARQCFDCAVRTDQATPAIIDSALDQVAQICNSAGFGGGATGGSPTTTGRTGGNGLTTPSDDDSTGPTGIPGLGGNSGNGNGNSGNGDANAGVMNGISIALISLSLGVAAIFMGM